MSYPVQNTPPSKNPEPLNTKLLVAFCLLMLVAIPALPIYLWRKGRLSAKVGIGLAVGWFALFVIASNLVSDDDKEAKPEAKPSPSSSPTPTETPSPSATTTPTAAKPDESKALVGKAEKLVLAGLPDTPFWKGTKANGVFVSDTEVCVDRTMKDGSAGGYVTVTFPDEKLSEPTDGTCAKPTTVTDYASTLKDAFESDLGGSNRDLERVVSVVYNEDTKALVVNWTINENLTDKLTNAGVRLDLEKMLKSTQAEMNNGMELKTATYRGTYSMADSSGKASESEVAEVEYAGDTIKVLDFDTFNRDKVYDLAERATVNPGFK